MRPVLRGIRPVDLRTQNPSWAPCYLLAPRSTVPLNHNSRSYRPQFSLNGSAFSFLSDYSRRNDGHNAAHAKSPSSKEWGSEEGASTAPLESESMTENSSTNEHGNEKVEATVAEFPVPGSLLYGKWRDLSLDFPRLLDESDVNATNCDTILLIDQPEHKSDIALWSCLLDFSRRRMGRDGAIMIWQAVSKRKTLHDVDGELARAFWSAMLDVALSSEVLLKDVLAYAEWLFKTHGVKWPNLYRTIISHLLSTHAKNSVLLRWHFRLSASFQLEEREFLSLLKEYIMNSDLAVQRALQLLYCSYPFRSFYEVSVPHLYSSGHSILARSWRKVFLMNNDEPATYAARPFLRFLVAYYPKTYLSKQERLTADLETKTGLRTVRPESVWYLINRLHGQPSGFKDKLYNDNIGAKWFASTWVPLDFAINVVYSMGVTSIGPLSLQSIALREPTAEGVLHRLDQLRQLKIQLPRTNYARGIRHLAAVGDNDTLQDLLHCDIHPDVFEDTEAQNKLLDHCLLARDWRTYRLILSMRLAGSSDSIATISNGLLESCAHQGLAPMALTILKDMFSQNVRLLPTTSHTLSSFILHNVSPLTDKFNKSLSSKLNVGVYVSICRQLAQTRFPPAVEVWRTLLYRLGRQESLDDLERLALDVVRMFEEWVSSEKPMMVVHMADVPGVLREESPYPKFQDLPHDLPFKHAQHPVQQIFDSHLQSSIVRWGFQQYQSHIYKCRCHPKRIAGASQPSDFYFARGVRLLAMLRDHGVVVNETAVQKATLLRLIEFYPPESDVETVGRGQGGHRSRQGFSLTLAESRKICEAAWGSSYLSSERELENIIYDSWRTLIDKSKHVVRSGRRKQMGRLYD